MSKNNDIYKQNGIEVYPFACSDCGKTPVIADVGGNNPYYEISCGCGKSPVVGAHSEKEVITTWNILNKKR